MYPDGVPSSELQRESWETTTLKRLLDTCHQANSMEPQRELLYHAWDEFLCNTQTVNSHTQTIDLSRWQV